MTVTTLTPPLHPRPPSELTTRERRGEWLCLGAGLCDGTTGVLLLVAPVFTLHWLGLGIPDGAAIYLRLIGVFVGCVGVSYLAPFTLPRGSRRRQHLRTIVELTAGVRLAVALFVAISVIVGALALGWLIVGFTDAGVALAQLALLVLGGFGPGGSDDHGA